MLMLVEHDAGRLLSVREAATYLGLSPLTVYRKLGSGEIAFLRLGAGAKSPIRIRAGALETFLRASARAGDDPAAPRAGAPCGAAPPAESGSANTTQKEPTRV